MSSCRANTAIIETNHWYPDFTLSHLHTIIFAFFPLQASNLLCTTTLLFLSHKYTAFACMLQQYLCLFICLPLSLPPFASQGNRVLHVIAPSENQIGTSLFPWVCTMSASDTHSDLLLLFFFFFPKCSAPCEMQEASLISRAGGCQKQEKLLLK